MAKLDDNLSDNETVMAAHQFLNDLQDAMKGVAALLTPQEEEAVNAAIQQRSKPLVSNYKSRDAVTWDATTKAPDDTAWDWPSADKRLRSWSGVDGDNPTAAQWAKYRMAFAWYDPSSADTLGGYKLPHHDIIGGKLCVVLKGVQAAMGALNGARGGTTIPAKDQDGVYQHLVKHYHQFGATPPDQRSVNVSAIERRTASFALGDGNTLVGTAAVFNQWTTIQTRSGSFEEQIRPGAFDNIGQCSVKALFNHDPNQILGSTDAGNVVLRQTGNGLDFQIKLLPTTLGKDIKTLVSNGVITGCSFGFLHDDCTDEWNGNQRTLTNIPSVVDVSVVTYPAYPQTNVNLRSRFDKNELWKYAIAMRKLKMK